MFPAQVPPTDPDEFMRCGESSQLIAEGQSGPNENTRADATLAHEIDRELWKDSILRALDYGSIDVRVRNGIVALYGHVTSLTNRRRAETASRSVDGVLCTRNHLIADEDLVAQVATALGSLEHTHDCKFFTGVSHGVVLLSGTVDNAETRLMAEKCAAGNPNVRAVINSVRVRDSSLDLLEDRPFLQPSIGVEIFFLDGISGRVRQVIINPDNRRVVAMTLRGRFADQQQELKSLNNGEGPPPEQTFVLPMSTARYLTKSSGFLNIRCTEKNQYLEFNPVDFSSPSQGWKPPYPYCLEDVLFPVEKENMANQIPEQIQSAFALAMDHQVLKEELLANDSLGG